MNIFISHSTLEAELAKYLATWLQENMANVQCFCSSRREDLPPGVGGALEEPKAAVLSPRLLAIG